MPPLNFDLLTHVLIHLSTDETSCFLTICKALYPIVVRKLLTSVTFCPESGRKDYIDLVLADPSNRIPLIRTMTIHVRTCRFLLRGRARMDKFVSLMIEVLKQSRSIQTISLSVPPNFFIRYPHVKDALVCNETLVDLTLCSAAIKLLSVLKDMRSNLRVLSLESMRMEDCPRDFSWLPTRCALQELRISYPTSWPQWSMDKGLQFPSVRCLYVDGPLPIRCLINVFPNIRSLTLNQYCT